MSIEIFGHTGMKEGEAEWSDYPGESWICSNIGMVPNNKSTWSAEANAWLVINLMILLAFVSSLTRNWVDASRLGSLRLY